MSSFERHLDTALAGVDPVSLPELNANAELLSRVDKKYILSEEAAVHVLAELAEHSRVLQITGGRSFDYSSVYYDTAARDSYLSNAHGRSNRFKVRTRLYRNSGERFLEIKTKDGRGHTVKQRIPAASGAGGGPAGGGPAGGGPAGGPARTSLIGGVQHLSFIESVLTSPRFPANLAARLQPCLHNSYTRRTLLLPDNSRLTCDSSIRWTDLFNSATQTATIPGFVIIETKSAGQVSAADRVLWAAGIRPTSVSKFGAGTAALARHLPHNRWYRVVRNHFRVG